MSLFKRLKERGPSQDSQHDSNDNARNSGEEGGLFGSVSLGPANREASVPPPPGSHPPAGASADAPVEPAVVTRRDVPSIEDARAEFDRARAEMGSGLFRRDKTDEPADETPLAAPQAAPSDRESVSFGTVSLPVVSAESSLTESVLTEPAESWQAEPAPKTFKLPSLSEFGDDAKSEVTAEPMRRGEAEAVLESETVYASPSQTPPATAPEMSAPPVPPVPEVVYAPTPQDEREVVARTEPQTVAPGQISTAIEELRPAPAESRTVVETQTVEAVQPAPVESPVPVAQQPAQQPAQESAQAPSEEKSAPAPRAANNSNLTPFQRLMAARAAQGGPPVSRPRVERPERSVSAPIAPVAEEVPVAATAQTPVDETLGETPVVVPVPTVEVPEIAAPVAIEPPSTPLVAVSAPTSLSSQAAPIGQVESAMPEVLQAQTVPVELPTVPAIETPQIQISDARPAFEAVPAEVASHEPVTAPEAPEQSSKFAPVELTKPESPQLEAPEAEVEAPIVQAVDAAVTAPLPVAEIGDAQKPDAPAEMPLSQTSETSVSGGENGEPQSEIETVSEDETKEAEIVPESEAASSEAASSEAVSNEAASENLGAQKDEETEEEPVVAAPSLAERLAQAPRAELDAAHAEAESLVPEVLREAVADTTETASSEASRMAVPVSFAERLAARKRAQEDAAPALEARAELRSEPATEEAPEKPEAPETPMNSAPSAPPPDEPRRSTPRSFSERLAARTGLDRHLQVPAEETYAPTSQELANANTELARIDEGAQLSEREMKNRVMFRQKHLIFDSVVGSIDQRILQNPSRETVKPQIERGVDAALREFNLGLEPSERNWMVDEFTRETTDLGPLVPMLEDPSIAKIVVTGANDVSVERLGRIERTGVSFRDDDHLLSLVRRIAEMSGGRVDAKVPLLDRPLPDGGRIRAKVPPLAPQPTLTIEKSTGNPFVQLKRQMEEKSRGESLPYAQLRERIQQKLLREFEGDAAALGGDQDKLRGQVEEMIGQVISEEHVVVTRAERASLVMDLLNEIVGLGPIEPLLNDPDVDEVMVNGPYQIYVERKGKLELTSQRFRDNAHVMQVIDRIVAPLGRRVDEKSPMVDGRLRDGSRFNAVIPPLALSGPTMTIRKFARDPFTMSDLINFGSMTREAAQFLQAAVEGRLNIVVSGGTGSGKTTTLNVLSSFIPSTERIVTIEDAAELQMRQEHVIRMETRPPNIEGVGEIGIRDLVRNSLRMRPDRIVVGECRGGEALDMLQAMNTGHDGSLTTAHSNGPRDTCKRLETMVMMAGFDLPVRAIREQISMAVQLIVHQERMRDGKRRVTAITEIVGMESDVLTMQDIFRFEQESIDEDGRIIGQLQATGMRPKYYETIIDNGVQLSMDLFHPKPMGEAAPRARLAERGGR